MKYFLGIVLLVAAASAAKYPQLLLDLHDFAMLMSREEAIAIGLDYLQNDAEVQRFVQFATSDKMKDLLLDLEGIHDYQNILRLAQSSGIDVYSLLTALHDLLGMPSYVPPQNYIRHSKVSAPGVSGLFQSLEKLMPLEKLAEMKKEKLSTDTEFKKFYNLITSSEYQKLACTLEANTEFKRILAYGEQNAFYPAIIRDWAFKLWGIPKRNC